MQTTTTERREVGCQRPPALRLGIKFCGPGGFIPARQLLSYVSFPVAQETGVVLVGMSTVERLGARNGAPVNRSPAVDFPVWASEVTGLIERRWGRDYRRCAAIVVVPQGGGALLLREALLTRFGGKAFLPQAPVLATSRGLYKMALMQAARKRARPGRDGAGEAADG